MTFCPAEVVFGLLDWGMVNSKSADPSKLYECLRRITGLDMPGVALSRSTELAVFVYAPEYCYAAYALLHKNRYKASITVYTLQMPDSFAMTASWSVTDTRGEIRVMFEKKMADSDMARMAIFIIPQPVLPFPYPSTINAVAVRKRKFSDPSIPLTAEVPSTAIAFRILQAPPDATNPSQVDIYGVLQTRKGKPKESP